MFAGPLYLVRLLSALWGSPVELCEVHGKAGAPLRLGRGAGVATHEALVVGERSVAVLRCMGFCCCGVGGRCGEWREGHSSFVVL